MVKHLLAAMLIVASCAAWASARGRGCVNCGTAEASYSEGSSGGAQVRERRGLFGRRAVHRESNGSAGGNGGSAGGYGSAGGAGGVKEAAPVAEETKSAGCGCGCPNCTGKPGCKCCDFCKCDYAKPSTMIERAKALQTLNAWRLRQGLPLLLPNGEEKRESLAFKDG